MTGSLLPHRERLTRLGIFLRRSSLDELWNVLKRSLSIVGPCPLLIEYLKRYELVSFIDDDRLTGTMK